MFSIIGAILPVLSKVLDRIIPDPEARRAAEMEIQKTLLENEGEITKAMQEVMVADSQQDDKYVKRARPTVVYWSLGLITGIAVVSPFGYADDIVSALAKVPDALYTLMAVGIGAFSLTRGGEKMARNWFKK